MLDPAAVCETILGELRGHASDWERFSPLDSQTIVLASFFVQTHPTPSEFLAQLEEFSTGARGALLAEAARQLLARYEAAHVAP